MVFFCAAKQPLELFGEPDPATAPRSRVDAAAILTLVAELGPWAKVRRTDRPDIAQTGWVLREHLTRIEGDASQRFVLFPEPFAEAGQALEGRLARVVIALGAWRKIVVLRADGTPFSGWVEQPAVGPDLPIGADIPATVSPPIAPPIVAAAEGGALQLGVNALYREPLLKAQAKTGIDAAALAAMIDAEAGTIKVGPQKGQWDARAFNGSSGAAGLTQFLASTWLDHARGADHELNRHALREQLVDQDGNVVDGRRDDLLALRFDPMLSILSAAEYGLANLKGLIRKGLVEAGTPDDRKAWFMYLAHHEGLTGASGFLDKTKTYSLGNLSVQVGSVKAAELAAAAGGDANRAYRLWLEAYINKKIQPSRFRGSGRSSPIATPGAAGGPSPAAGSSLALPPEEVLAYAALGNEARAFLLGHDGPALPFPTIGGNAALTKAIQEALSVHGYLDPPADGEFGPVSLWALTQFARKAGFDPEAGASRALAAALADPASGLPAIAASGVWIDKVIRFMQAKGYFISRHPECWNIVYIEGLGLDGVANADLPNRFNDVRAVFRIAETGAPEFKAWDATTEPGDFFTNNPENPGGAARIAFRQFKSWCVGMHPVTRTPKHEALLQVKPLTVHRDFNKDHRRTGDALDRGIFGINQHWGFDASPNDIANTSAGCLVGRTREGHREFMALVKSDARFKASKGYRFVTAIVPGDKLDG